jgi:hypothetical protein
MLFTFILFIQKSGSVKSQFGPVRTGWTINTKKTKTSGYKVSAKKAQAAYFVKKALILEEKN